MTALPTASASGFSGCFSEAHRLRTFPIYCVTDGAQRHRVPGNNGPVVPLRRHHQLWKRGGPVHCQRPCLVSRLLRSRGPSEPFIPPRLSVAKGTFYLPPKYITYAPCNHASHNGQGLMCADLSASSTTISAITGYAAEVVNGECFNSNIVSLYYPFRIKG